MQTFKLGTILDFDGYDEPRHSYQTRPAYDVTAESFAEQEHLIIRRWFTMELSTETLIILVMYGKFNNEKGWFEREHGRVSYEELNKIAQQFPERVLCEIE